jgi:hypothetical protein
VSAGCDDDDGGFGGGNGSTTSSTSTTTTNGGPSTTQTTVSTSTTSVTTGSSTTTTTVGGGGVCDCVVTFSCSTTDTLGSLQYDTDYSASGGGFDGAAGTVSCQRLVGDFGAFNDIEASSTLSTAFISAAGFTTPAAVATCDFTGPTQPAVGDFAVTVTDAARPDFTNVTASTVVAVSDVTCTCTGGSTTTLGGGSTTTTVSGGSTTTTVSGGSTTTTTGGGTTTTTTGGSANLYDVTFDMADAGTAVGALQFEVQYATAGGQFVGTADSVDCDSPIPGGAFVTFNDEDATTTLNFAAVALAGFSGPLQVARCTFDAPVAPSPAAFVITVVDASDTALAPITPFPTVTPTVTPQ